MALIARLLLLSLLLVPGLAQAQKAWSGYYPEGPVWIGDTLYWAEMGGDRIMSWTGGEPEVAWTRKGCGPTALARYRDDGFAVLCHFQGAVAVLDRDMRVVQIIRATADGQKLRNPNDVSADGAGGVWFTDPGPFAKSAGAVGAVYHLSADGALTRHAEGLFYGNGVHIDHDGRRLLVSEHLARRVLAYPITEGGLGEPEILFELDAFDLPKPRYDHSGPDGLEIAPDGTVWVAEYGTARLLGWRPDEGLVAAMSVDAQFITNIAFGPHGLAAITAPKDNRTPPYPGIIWVFEDKVLDELKIR